MLQDSPVHLLHLTNVGRQDFKNIDRYFFAAILAWIFMYFIQHCVICRPSVAVGLNPGVL
jgi:hypothetical protein